MGEKIVGRLQIKWHKMYIGCKTIPCNACHFEYSVIVLQKALRAQCRDCGKMHIPGLTPFQLAWAKDPGQKRWRYYPDLTSTLTSEQIRASMARLIWKFLIFFQLYR